MLLDTQFSYSDVKFATLSNLTHKIKEKRPL